MISLGGLLLAGSQGGTTISEKKNRRKWTCSRKLRFVLEALHGQTRLSAICRCEGLNPTRVHQRRRQLLHAAEAIYTPKRETQADRRLQKLAAENARMRGVIAESTAENLEPKKRYGLSDHAPLPVEL